MLLPYAENANVSRFCRTINGIMPAKGRASAVAKTFLELPAGETKRRIKTHKGVTKAWLLKQKFLVGSISA